MVDAAIDARGERLDLLLVEHEEFAMVSGPTLPYRARVLHVTEDYHWEIEMEGLRRAFHGICRLSPKRVVLFSWGRDRQPNAFLFDENGAALSQFWVGNYVAHAQADARGRLWVSYFDQGFGQEYSATGFNCYDADGQALQPWWFCPMLDCYAMNAARDGIWSCGYTDFPIRRVGLDGGQTSWTNEVRGARAILTWGQQVALYGGYEKRTSQLTRLRLGRERAEVESECVAHLPEGQEPGWVGGRGSHFHTLHEGVWHRLDPGLRAL